MLFYLPLINLPGLLPAVGCSLLKESSCWFEAGLGLTLLLAPLPAIRPEHTKDHKTPEVEAL